MCFRLTTLFGPEQRLTLEEPILSSIRRERFNLHCSSIGMLHRNAPACAMAAMGHLQTNRYG